MLCDFNHNSQTVTLNMQNVSIMFNKFPFCVHTIYKMWAMLDRLRIYWLPKSMLVQIIPLKQGSEKPETCLEKQWLSQNPDTNARW